VSRDDRDQSPFLRSLAVAELLARPFGARNQPRLNGGRSVLNAPRRPAVSVMKRLVSPRFPCKSKPQRFNQPALTVIFRSALRASAAFGSVTTSLPFLKFALISSALMPWGTSKVRSNEPELRSRM
jgi:hypothetical protein